MKNKFARLILLFVLLIAISSCGRTVYRSKYAKSNKYIRYKKNNNFWHRHYYRPHPHFGGYW